MGFFFPLQYQVFYLTVPKLLQLILDTNLMV